MCCCTGAMRHTATHTAYNYESIHSSPAIPRPAYSEPPSRCHGHCHLRDDVVAMSTAAAAVSALRPRPPRLHQPSPTASRRPCTLLPFRRRLTTACAAAVPVSAIGPANADSSIFKVTLDLSDAPELAASYTTPGQLVQASVPSSGFHPAYMEISSAPGAQHLDLLARSVPGTTTEVLCGLGVSDHVELGAASGTGLPVQSIKEAENVLCFAVAEGLSPIRALIKSGLTNNNVILYYGARNQEAVPLQEELNEWQQTGVNVIEVLQEPVHYPFLRGPDKIIKNPNSTVAVLAGPMDMQQEVKRALEGHGVPSEKILTIEQWYPNY